MRIIHTYTSTRAAVVKTAVVYFHAEWKDYFVRFFINGTVQKLMTYAALDLDDAMSRAEWFVDREG